MVSARQTLLGLAESRDQRALKRALAQLDYRRQLNFAVLIAICERGRPGSTTLRRALSQHDPKLAYTNEDLEAKFLALCRRWRLPPARLNVRVHGVLVDAHWPQANLVVELDGLANHSSPAQRRRDHGNDLKLRSYGLEVRRYDWVLLSGRDSKLVRLELERLLGIRA